ncbi:ABC transporter permease [Flagellimonas pacifica]|uniref:Putative ABC transport system permease protein n=1 Tax=Flagellimonas pacifica TaxID=1247520 RepID=A0A285MEN6_9FLAO|nr:ABC transporter permease [Allomuricauda parva]SNY94917.1 putative ABC transport system permease protein [Allomuricauda parva]
MLKNYIKIAWRNIVKNKIYSLINIGGLAIGMSCFLLITLYIIKELSYDSYHENGNQIYRVLHHSNSEDTSKAWVWGNAPVGPALKTDFPEIVEKVQFSGRSAILLKYEANSFQENECFYADPAAFEVFSWPLVSGDPKTALEAPYSIVLTETTAKKYFGDQNPLGKTIEGVGGRANDGNYTVTGVMKDVPENSHFSFDVLMSMGSFYQSRPGIFDAWGYVDFYTYLLVSDNFDQKAFQSKIPSFLEKHIEEVSSDEYFYNISLESLDQIYLHSKADRQPGITGSLSNIYIFAIIGLFILIIACINFMNLSTARSLERAKEVGVRKVIGANRKGLTYQFFGESLVLVLLSSIIGLLLVFLALPWMSNLTGISFYAKDVLQIPILLFFFGTALLTALFSGSYPALILSGFKPVSILRGTYRKSPQGANLRKGLVIFQFSLSIALIASTVIVYDQLGYMFNKDMGFDKEQQLILDFNWDQEVIANMETIKSEFKAMPNVTSVSMSRTVPGSHFPAAGTEVETVSGNMEHFSPYIYEVDNDFIPHYNIEVVAGRAFSPDFPTDSIGSLVINEAAVKAFGYSEPNEIIGKKFDQWGRQGTIIGVVKDFNYLSLHQDIAPLTLRQVPYGQYFSIKLNSDDYYATVSKIRQKWAALAPHRPFLYSFLDTSFNEQYQADVRFRKLFTIFSFLTIFIACLGLFGLVTYSALQRTKEIGIRKVLGAEVTNIIALISKDFIKLVGIALLIAIPFSWYAMDQWLNDFAYRIEIQWWVFVLSGVLALCITFFTISFQAVKSALVNPVKSLKTE